VRVVIGEDETLLREGLSLVVTRAGFEVVAAVGDATALVAATLGASPDLAITDIRMPPDHTDDGLRAAEEILRAAPGVAVLVLSQHVNREYALELVEARTGGVGYLLKHRIAAVDEFVDAMRTVASGGSVVDPDLMAPLIAARPVDDPVARLTDRQREVLRLMAAGRSNASIADELVITEKAVVRHVSHVYDELGIPQTQNDHRRVLAVLRYLARGEVRFG